MISWQQKRIGLISFHRQFPNLILCFMLLILNIIQVSTVTSNPVFITTMSGFQCGSWVLTTTNPVTTSGISTQTTTLNYVNLYTTSPNVGFGYDFINSVYATTSSLTQLVIDVTITQKLTSSITIQLSRTVNSIQQLSLNYIVCDSSFFLDIRHTYVDLISQIVFTTASSVPRNVIVQLPYKIKSNSSNSKLAYNTVGLHMIRQSKIYQLQITTSFLSTNSFNLTILVGGFNRLKWIRICSYSYQAIANSIDAPYYMDLGTLTSFSGYIPDPSGLSSSEYGFIYTGMLDWMIDDSNSVLNYNLSTNGLSYQLSTTSLSSSKTAYLWYRKLSCPDYTFLNIDNLCESCHYSCLTCVSSTSTTCLTCPSTRVYVSTNHSCVCQSGYVDVGVSLCVQLTCQPTCLTCANLNQCGSCETGFDRILNGTECVCKPYKIDVYQSLNTKVCYPCHYTCYTCSQAFMQNQCLSCNQIKDHRFYRQSNNTCSCLDKYFPSTTTPLTPVCTSCQYSCATCTNLLSCLTCNITKARIKDTKYCKCISGYYDNLLNQQCIACPLTCLTCNSNGCLSCNSTLNRQLINKVCVCMSGYFDDKINVQCQQCHYSCSTCNDLTQCTSCNSSLQRYMETSTSINLCLCANGYYSQYGIQSCMFCDTSCSTCDGGNDNNCLSCNINKYRSLSLQNRCVCMIGYFQVSSLQQLCSACYYTCQTCDNEFTCLSCNNTRYRTIDLNNNCLCMDGYYDNGNELCLKCPYYCTTCSSNLQCDTCDSLTRDTANLTTCGCLIGFYDDKISSSCQPCLSQCLTCDNPNNCKSCPLNQVLTLTKDCICKSRTYQPNCLSCSHTCQQCVNTANQCTKCNGSAMRYYNSTLKSCSCYNGYFDDGVNQLCLSCHYSCQTCNSYSNCLTCPLSRIKNGSICSCITQYYQQYNTKQCIQCHYSCKQCQTYSQCTQCDNINNHRVFPQGFTNLTLCICMNGYYDNTINQLCYQCDNKCMTCTNYNKCLSCDSSLNRYLDSLNKDCLCIDGYYQHSSTFLCLQCHYSCQTCIDSNECLTCKTGRVFQSLSGGFCICQLGHFNDINTNICIQCQYPCNQCIQTSLTCTSCDNQHQLIDILSECVCKIGTFENGTSCESCMSQCQQCTQLNKCDSCKIGSNRNLDANYLCPCVYGYHDQNNSILTCLKCDYSCLQCQNSYSCKVCYPGRIAVVNSTCVCPINKYYDDNVNGACISCHYTCQTCINISTNCTSCSSQFHRSLINNQCICDIGYYQNAIQLCSQCHYSCMQCIDYTQCTDCNNSLSRYYQSGPYCECSIGYYDDKIYQQCALCHYSCQTCMNTNSECYTCDITRTLDTVNKKCPCNTHLYDSGLSTCSQCKYNCKQCLNNIQCILCPQSRYFQPSTKDCLCKDGLYNVNLQLQCLSCHPLCLTCTDYSICLTCDTSNTDRQLFNNNCICPNGYYDNYILSNNVDKVCKICHYSCQNCVSLQQCSSCDNINARRIYNVISKLCSCRSGYYDDGINQQCFTCPFDCLTCSDSNTCITCSSQRILNTTTNRCHCGTAYYTNNTKCQPCVPQCLTCSNLTFCLDCQPGLIYQQLTGKCACPIGKYIIPNSAVCNNCQYSCQSCVSLLKCSTCNSSLKRYLSGSFCLCNDGYYDDKTNQLCPKCHYSCKTCRNSQTCLSCKSEDNRVFNIDSQLCECVSGYYQDSSTLFCLKCNPSCVTCQNGTSCLSCNPLYQRYLNNSTYECQCLLIGYYDNGIDQMCLICDYKCLSCQNSSTLCTSCGNNTFRTLILGGQCECIDGYYQASTQICPKCSYKCVTCQGQQNNCTMCSIVNQRDTIPLCQCLPGFYQNGIQLCQKCDYRCLTCISSQTCTECDPLMNRIMNNVTSVCDCQINYYDNGFNHTLCTKCHYSCLNCQHNTLCLTCPSTRIFVNGLCKCLTKYYDDGSSLQCKPCHYTCKKCTNSTQCSDCSINYYRKFNFTTKYCSCVQKYYDTGNTQICSRCQLSCKTCTNSTHCSTCPININKTINLTISNYCTCLYGYYQNKTAGLFINQTSVCYICHYSCQKCLNQSTICIQCQINKNRYLTLNNKCVCNSYYYDDGVNQLCIKCYSNCLTCWGTQQFQCLSCDNNSYFLNNSCYSSCPDYYMQDINPITQFKICTLCASFCLQCNPTKTICLTCQSNYRKFYYNSTHTLCLDKCPLFYYDKNNMTCLQCIAPCLRCKEKYQCIDCITGYYLDNYCYKCHQYCYSCKGPTVFDCIKCINGYYLDQGLCRKIACLYNQYVNSLLGCINCNSTYPNSQTCNLYNIITCKQNYILQTYTNQSTKLNQTICKSCKDTPGYKLTYLSSGQQSCIQICGDGITIEHLCDDGNTLNGDGCSSNCKIQPNWICNKISCQLKIIPQIQLIKVIKVYQKNQVQVYLLINVGIRFLKDNFLLSFSDSLTKFTYQLESLNSKFTEYKLKIYYQNSIQTTILKMNVISPIPLKNTFGRSLEESKILTPLAISLSLDLSIQIQTRPPAIYVDEQTRSIYSITFFYIFICYQLICIIMALFMVYKRIKFMLLIADIINSLRTLFVICAFGMYQITELVPSSAVGLRHFIYGFGTDLYNSNSIFHLLGYKQQIFSSCIIQILILIFCLAIYYLSNQKQNKNQGYYYFNAFIYCFSFDIYLSCICVFSEVLFETFIGSYSQALSIIIFLIIISHNFIYINQAKNIFKKSKKVLPQKSIVTIEVDARQKQQNIFDMLQISSDKKYKQIISENQTQVLTNKYQDNQDKIKKFGFSNQTLKIYDLQPVQYNKSNKIQKQSLFYKSPLQNTISLYHLPVLNSLFPLILISIVSLIRQKILLRSILLFIIFLFALIFIIYEKISPIKTIRNLKLLFNYSVSLVICLILIIGSSIKSNDYLWIDISIICLILISIVANIFFWVYNLRTSPQYKQYLIQLKNKQILFQNKLQSQPRKRIYINQQQYNNQNPIKNIFTGNNNIKIKPNINNQSIYANQLQSNDLSVLGHQQYNTNYSQQRNIKNQQKNPKQKQSEIIIQNKQKYREPEYQIIPQQSQIINNKSYSKYLRKQQNKSNSNLHNNHKAKDKNIKNQINSHQQYKNLKNVSQNQLNLKQKNILQYSAQQQSIESRFQQIILDNKDFINKNKKQSPNKVSILKSKQPALDKNQTIISKKNKKKENNELKRDNNEVFFQNSDSTFVDDRFVTSNQQIRINKQQQKNKNKNDLNDKILNKSENIKINSGQNNEKQIYYQNKQYKKKPLHIQKQKYNNMKLEKNKPIKIHTSYDNNIFDKSLLSVSPIGQINIFSENQDNEKTNIYYAQQYQIEQIIENKLIQEKQHKHKQKIKLKSNNNKRIQKIYNIYDEEDSQLQQQIYNQIQNQSNLPYSDNSQNYLKEKNHPILDNDIIDHQKYNTYNKSKNYFNSQNNFNDKNLLVQAQQNLSDISSIQQKKYIEYDSLQSINYNKHRINNLDYSQLSQITSLDGKPSVYEKILINHQKYKNKKIDKIILKTQLEKVQVKIQEKEEQQSQNY